ncbi:MAG TPA: ATP-dependent DNA helicase [Actinomycetes bacterium]|nr:ATP-dependent DNA helicase [Actinomycetes bacterium]
MSPPSLDRPEGLRELLGVALTEEQLAAATAPLEPAVVVAGAGSGKTSVMAARVVWLVGTGQARPEEVLGLTFTNKAAAELAHRLRTALARAGVDESEGWPTVATYHAYAGRLLREHGLRIGIEPQATLLADATRFQLAERVLRRARGPYRELDTTVATLVGDVVALEAELSEHLVSTGELRDHDTALLDRLSAVPRPAAAVREAARAARKRRELSDVVDALRTEKAERALLDFGDQLRWATRLAAEQPAVGATERECFRVVLLDEYQDTSVAQRVLLTSLFAVAGHPVTAVGDPCQAIYGWRGASVANIDAFPAHFRRGDGSPARRYVLTQNNRSGGHLLALANDLSRPLRARHAAVPELHSRPGAEANGWVHCALMETAEDEVAWVAEQIAGLLAGGEHRPRDVAVLLRARSGFAALHAALTARGVPVEVVGLGGLLQLPEVADLVATLRVLDEPTENAALLRLLTGPRWRIGPRDLALLGRRASALVGVAGSGGRTGELEEAAALERSLEEAVAGVDPAEVVSLCEALEHPGAAAYSPQARARFTRLAAELRELRAHLGEPLVDLVRRVLAVTGLEVEASRASGLGAFVEHAAGFADLDGDPSVRAFLAFLDAAEDFDQGLDTTAASDQDSVKVMTVHKAKGLEWPVVVVPDLTAGVFPATRGRPRWTRSAKTLPNRLRGDAEDYPEVREWSGSGLADFDRACRDLDAVEERRLAYVAATRAKDLLLASSHWWGPTQARPRGPSQFLRAIKEHCDAGFGTVARWAEEPVHERNPGLEPTHVHEWPPPLDPAALVARREGADLVRAALIEAGAVASQLDLLPVESSGLGEAQLSLVAAWDSDLASLLEEEAARRAAVREVALPDALSASAVVRLVADPDGLARDLARPMPRPPADAASRGTRFHAWVEAHFGSHALIDRTDLTGAADAQVDAEADLAQLKEAFLRGPYASRVPLHVEAPFQLVLGGRVVRGRIDAVYVTEDGFDVVDWKTGRRPADPLQLALYRAAWARVAGVPEERVGAAFYDVLSGRVVRPDRLPGGEELAELLSPSRATRASRSGR